MMPSLATNCTTKTSNINTMSGPAEIFSSYNHRDERESDEESFHLPLDDEDSDRFQDEEDNTNDFETTVIENHDSSNEKNNEETEEDQNEEEDGETTLMEIDDSIPNVQNNSPEENNTSTEYMDDLVCEDEDDKGKISNLAETVANENEEAEELEAEETESLSNSESKIPELNEDKEEEMEVDENEEDNALQEDKLEETLQNKDKQSIIEDEEEHTNDETKLLENSRSSDDEKESSNLENDKEFEDKILESDEEDRLIEDDDEDKLIDDTTEKLLDDKEQKDENKEETRNFEKKLRNDECAGTDKSDDDNDGVDDDENKEQINLRKESSEKTNSVEETLTKEVTIEEKIAEDPTDSLEDSSEENKKSEELNSDKPTENIDDKDDQTDNDKNNKTKPNEKLPLKTCDNTFSDERLSRQESKDSTNEEKVSDEEKNDNDDDLFDISVIKDAQEDHDDNVKAYNENEAEENDDDDRTVDKAEDDSNDKTNLEEDEDMDSERTDQAKNDDDDFDEFTCDGSKDTSDVETDKTVEAEPQLANGDSRHSNIDSGLESCDSDKVVEMMDTSESKKDSLESEIKKEIKEEEKEEKIKIEDKRPVLKRSLDGKDEDEDFSPLKKSRTIKTEPVNNEMEQKLEISPKKPDKPLATLLSLAAFMQDKKQTRRMTMQDLEQFALLKVCEALVDNSELGEARHHIKMQEHLIEAMRKEMQQLSKQVRDLEIVNKKLMNDVKQHQQGLTQKPLNPLRITRSVGLQVKFTNTVENNVRRRAQNIVLTAGKNSSPGANVNPNRNRNIPNATSPGVTTKTAQASPQKQAQPPTTTATTTSLATPKTNGLLLSQALQNRSRASSTESPTKTPTPTAARPSPQKTPRPTASVIDLTDEDEKTNKNTVSKLNTPKPNNIARTAARVNNGTLRLTPAGKVGLTTQSGKVSLASQQGKVTLATSQTKGATVVTSSAPQLMYVVQSSSSTNSTLTGAKAVVVNFQPNGVLPSALNGSAVSMIPKQNSAVQLKTISQTKPISSNVKPVKSIFKHPAPLPPPPIVRVNFDKPLKPIPPKPHLTIRKTDTGIILQWKMPYELDMYELIASYQLYAYQETSAQPSTDMWRKVGDVKALALPMACTLTQFADKNKYYFAVRPVDIHKRIGVFSEPEEISL